MSGLEIPISIAASAMIGAGSNMTQQSLNRDIQEYLHSNPRHLYTKLYQDVMKKTGSTGDVKLSLIHI